MFGTNLMITSSRCFFPTQMCLSVTTKTMKQCIFGTISSKEGSNLRKSIRLKTLTGRVAAAGSTFHRCLSMSISLLGGSFLSTQYYCPALQAKILPFARSECAEDTFTHLYLSAFHQLTDLLMSNQARLCSLPVKLLTRILSRESNSIKSPIRQRGWLLSHTP